MLSLQNSQKKQSVFPHLHQQICSWRKLAFNNPEAYSALPGANDIKRAYAPIKFG
jgi:hypothetical protein